MKIIWIVFLFCFVGFSVSATTVTSFIEKFDAALPSGWFGTSQYALSVANSELRMTVKKNKAWSSFAVNLPDTVDFSANPYVSVKVRASQSVRLMVYLVDATNNVVKFGRVKFANNRSSNLLIDFSAPGSVNLAKVSKLYIGVNGDALTWSGSVWIDEIRLADAAIKKATLGAMDEQAYYQGSTGNQLLVTDVTNASAIRFVDAETLIENVTVGSIINGTSTISFNVKAGVSGTAVAKIISTANDGFVTDTVDFNLSVERNLPPTATVQTSLDAKVGNPLSFSMTDLTDGNVTTDQKMSYSFTKVSGTSVNLQTIAYDTLSARINVSAQAVSSGITSFKLVLKDTGGELDSLVKMVHIAAYTNYNYPPNCDIQPDYEMFLSAGSIDIPILNATDGNTGTQTLTYSVVSYNTTIIDNASIAFINGNPEQPKISCTAIATGRAKLQLTITDDDFGFENGVKQTTKTFNILVKPDPLYGFTINPATFDADVTAGLYGIESQGVGQTVTSDIFGGEPCIKFVGNNKNQWTGLWITTPQMDVSANPFVSYEVYTVGSSIMTHSYFYDIYNVRNASGAHAERKTVPANVWTTVVMDFRGAGKMVNSSSVSLNANAISAILLNYNPSFPYPEVNWTGTMYIRNIRIGNAVTNPPVLTPIATINNPGNANFFKNDGAKKITITGISCGSDCNTTPVVTIKTNSNAALLSAVSLSALNNGNVDFNFTVGATLGATTITLQVASTGSTTTTKAFTISVLDNATSSTTFSIDTIAKKQVIAGFGGASPKIGLINQFISTGASVIRLFVTGDDIEPVNDNSSALTLDRTKFDVDGLRIDYIKAAYTAGIKDFAITVLTPPAWMKQNLSSVFSISQAPTWDATLNKVDPMYYDEYIEFMVATVQLIKEKTGVELMAICPQNEPSFCQPFGSAILDPVHMATICGQLGKKLAEMGYKTKVINAEQVFSQSANSVNNYITAVRADADANKYTSVIGMHYPTNTPATFETNYNNAKAEPYPKEYWGMEMRAEGNNWTNVMTQMQTLTTGLNYGVGLWAIYGWNGEPLMNNGVNAVGDQIAMTYGAVPSKHFYAVQNVYKHFRPGSRIVTSALSVANANVNMVTNLNNVDSVISIVWVNSGTANVVGTLAMPVVGAKVYRTSEFEDYQLVAPILGDKIILPAKSITTLAIPYTKNGTLPTALPRVHTNNEDGYQVFPNPAMGEFSILSNTESEFRISIFDLTGRRLFTKSNYKSGEAITISSMHPGLYNVMIQTDKTMVKKLIIK